ncbi:hypothetical protein HID58_094611 [Brassica napus]|uniref:Xaa-Pro dipeptidyl-peptidase-like domain-containing protein n=1 Tax=Brassica napus TaxID=3708 RepID=A0ABQ7X6S5_BRANA|nr:hypothetical protein HID58_094611 [Brassica napus]
MMNRGNSNQRMTWIKQIHISFLLQWVNQTTKKRPNLLKLKVNLRLLQDPTTSFTFQLLFSLPLFSLCFSLSGQWLLDRQIPPAPAPQQSDKGVLYKLLVVFSVCIATSTYQALQPPPPKLCGSPGGPSVTAPRIKLRDGRLGLQGARCSQRSSCPHDNAFAALLSPDIKEGLGVYMVSFDRPGYGESDADQTVLPKAWLWT